MREVISQDWDLIGMHPECTYMTVAGIHWNYNWRGHEKTKKALEQVRWLMSHKVPWYLENPVSVISTKIRKPDQIIQPYEFGEDASKSTCLWLNELPPLLPTTRFNGRIVEHPKGSNKFVERWSNQTDSGHNALPPSPDRWKERSKTYPGIANAMAAQWGHHLSNKK
jgi:hypothetical protein